MPWPSRISPRPPNEPSCSRSPERPPENGRGRGWNARQHERDNLAAPEKLTIRRVLDRSPTDRYGTYPVFQPSAAADSSSSDDDGTRPTAPARPTRPTHGRSLSHPLSFILPLGKKTSSSPTVRGINLDNSEQDVLKRSAPEITHAPPVSRPSAQHKTGTLPIQPSHGHTSSRISPGGTKELVAGSCMTCDSPMSWPQDVKILKCKKCMTVIDLRPYNPAQRPPPPPRRDRDRDRDDGERYGPQHHHDPHLSPRSSRRGVPISTEHTKALIRQCLKTYLTSTLEKAGRSSLEPSSPFHPSNPFFNTPENQERKQPLPWSSDETVPSASNRQAPRLVPGYFDPAAEPTSRPDKPRALQGPTSWQLSTSYPGRKTPSSATINEGRHEQSSHQNTRDADATRIFRPVEDYVAACFTGFECVNASFRTRQASMNGMRPSTDRRQTCAGGGSLPQIAPRKDSARPKASPPSAPKKSFTIERPLDRAGSTGTEPVLTDFDAKLLLVGDVAENGLWWTGSQDDFKPRHRSQRSDSSSTLLVNGRSPCIDWADVDSWYSNVLNAGQSWQSVYHNLVNSEFYAPLSSEQFSHVKCEILAAQDQVQRCLLKFTELMLKRPGRVITEPHELRFLLILMRNPLLHRFGAGFEGKYEPVRRVKGHPAQGPPSPGSGDPSSIIKRILGLISNTPIECHNHLISWLSRLSVSRFRQLKDLVGTFISYRLSRQHGKRDEAEVDVTAGLIPDMSSRRNGNSAASLHDSIAAPVRTKQKKPQEAPKRIVYDDDWQVKAAARVMSLIFAANNMAHARSYEVSTATSAGEARSARERIQLTGQILPTSDFYNPLLDYSDLIADYGAWESRRGMFSFCQFPFFLSIHAKIKIMEHDAKRQMELKARDAFFDSIMTRKAANQFLVLKVRRECLVEDSLRAVGEVVGSGSDDIKKRLHIDFVGEEGVDAGGPRKEWFQMLIREVFHPDHGMFTYDEDSHYCYFNPDSFEASDQFFVVGVVMGLAIYNSTMLDIALPPFAFRKLMSEAPAPALHVATFPRPAMTYTLDDLAEYRPRLARGLQQLLDFDGDVESTFCLDFIVETERYGASAQVPLCPGGEKMAVTNSNRREYVDLVTRHHLDIAVTKQYEPFKRGFFTVCRGKALSLFRPEEIELLVRGSDEPLDIDSLKAVAEYENWKRQPPQQRSNHHSQQYQQQSPAGAHQQDQQESRKRRGQAALTEQLGGGDEDFVVVYKPEEDEPTIRWFWDSFAAASPADQRRLLTFITGSDRIPATGAASLVIKIGCLGEDCGRYPVARTCFNTLQLHRYGSRERLDEVLWVAVRESEGFWLK